MSSPISHHAFPVSFPVSQRSPFGRSVRAWDLLGQPFQLLVVPPRVSHPPVDLTAWTLEECKILIYFSVWLETNACDSIYVKRKMHLPIYLSIYLSIYPSIHLQRSIKADTINISGNSPSSPSSPGERFLDTCQQGTDTGDSRGGGLHTSDSWNLFLESFTP